jgi:hypothetical protein
MGRAMELAHGKVQGSANATWGTVRVFDGIFTLEDAIGPHACSLEANMRVTNGIPLRRPLFLPVDTVNCVKTLKVWGQEMFDLQEEVLQVRER